MSLLLDALASLGLGGQLLVAATLVAAAMYAWKGAKVANVVAAYLSSGFAYVVVVCLAIALAVAANWIDPHPGAFLSFASEAVNGIIDTAGQFLSGVVG